MTHIQVCCVFNSGYKGMQRSLRIIPVKSLGGILHDEAIVFCEVQYDDGFIRSDTLFLGWRDMPNGALKQSDEW